MPPEGRALSYGKVVQGVVVLRSDVSYMSIFMKIEPSTRTDVLLPTNDDRNCSVHAQVYS
jgi:hypothetical protein